MRAPSLKCFECPTVFNFLLHKFMNHIYRNLSYSYSFISSSSCMGTTAHDEPWPLLQLLSIGPNPVTFVSNF
jgi:hypothetical protein